MNQRNFSLADVLSAVTAFVFAFISFLGVNFLNIENNKVWGMPHTLGCVVIALLIGMLLFATAYGAKRLKRTSRNFKTSFVAEVILLVLFALFAVVFVTKISPFTHYFTVTSQKSEINSKVQTSITQADSMFAAYESYAKNRETLYNKELNSIISAKRVDPDKYMAYGFQNNDISDHKQIDIKMGTLHDDLFPPDYSDTSTNNGIKEVATKWLQNATNITHRWKFIGIVGVVNNIDKNSNQWLSYLVQQSQIREENEQASDFNYLLSFEDVKTHFVKLDNPKPLTIGIAGIAYVLMLLSWFVTKRDSRSTGSLTTAPYEVVL